MMIFVLSMSLYGLSNMFTELVPSIKLGPIELSIEYFAFIPLTLCMLFHPLYAAVGAAVGEVIFGELMLGQFGGLGELEKFITFSLAMYTAGLMVSDPKNRRQVGVAAINGVNKLTGSSMTRISGSIASAPARASRCFCPPLSCQINSCLSSLSPVSAGARSPRSL
jgi:hypothetical protein